MIASIGRYSHDEIFSLSLPPSRL